MNPIQHYKASRKTEGIVISLLTMVPDVFVILRRVTPFKQFCLNLHNTEYSTKLFERFSSRLGKAWKLHREQDLSSHFNYRYDYSDLVPRDSIMLLSGGLDSFIQWRLLQRPRAIYFNIGHRAAKKEMEKIMMIQKEFGGEIYIDDSLKLGFYEMENGYIPYRNLLFIIMASYYSSNIILAQIAEWAPDKNRSFYRKTSKLLKEITSGHFQNLTPQHIKIFTPFSGYTKTKLISKYLERWPASDLTTLTVSCYSGNEKNCGKCSACFSRYVAMSNHGIEEEYEVIPNISKWDIRDFKFSQVPMYVKRWREMR